MSETATAPVVAGLAVGIGLVAIFAMGINPAMNIHDAKASSIERTISAVVIPKGATSSPSSGKNFEPSTIKVVIGVNNTVRWTNDDEILSSVVADNPGVDPDFAAKTQFAPGIIPANATNYLQPGKSFEFTFNRPGEIHYHDIIYPWMHGTVVVLSPSTGSIENNKGEDDVAAANNFNATVATTITTSARSAFYSSYDGLEQVPADRVLHGSYDGIDKDNGMVTINNQRYYLTTLNETVGEIKRGESIDFHNVTFSFPDGVFLTPGGIILIPDIKFQDGSEEVYGKSTIFSGGGGYTSGIGMPSSPHASKEPITVFTNHVHPQAALTLYNGNVKLLVTVG
ncbi:MAG TPA: hypothetical protein VHA09_02675 [Nitrososphaera sp.]|nr:hypothetical protein [Nitrososphaera sp.]